MKNDLPKTFTIGELAKAAAVNIQTIRFYEREGLLKPQDRLESGYRIYNHESLNRLFFIRHAKDLGFSLDEIQSLLNLRVRSAGSCDQVRLKAEKKLNEVQQKLIKLKKLETTLKKLVSDCKKRIVSDCCPILDRMDFKG